MLRDVEQLTSKLGKVEGFADLGTYLMKIIEAKDIRTAAPPAPPAAPAEAQSSAPTEDEESKEGEKADPQQDER
jgi:ribosomal protein L12E/L44/L45/RPP1/RPP2